MCDKFHNVLRFLARLINLRFEFVLGLSQQQIQLLVIRFELAYPVSLRRRRLGGAVVFLNDWWLLMEFVSIAQVDHGSDGSWYLLGRLWLECDFRLGEDLRGLMMICGLRLYEGLRVIAILRAQGRDRRSWLDIVVRACSLRCVACSARHLLGFIEYPASLLLCVLGGEIPCMGNGVHDLPVWSDGDLMLRGWYSLVAIFIMVHAT